MKLSALPALTLFAVCAASPARAETPAWTPAAYVRAVIAASPEIQQSRELLEASSARWKADIGNAVLPTLSASALSYPYGYNPANSYRFNSWRLNRDDMSLNAGLNWNIFNSFADRLSVRFSGLTRDIAQRELENILQNEALRALRAYYDLQLRGGLLEVALENFKTQKEQYNLTQDLYKHGMKSLSDLLKTETDWRSSELGLESARAERRLALLRFNNLIDRDPQLEAALKAEAPPTAADAPFADADIRKALLERPEMARSRLELERAKTAWRQSVQRSLPSLDFGFQWNYQESATFGLPSSQFGVRSPNHYFFLSLSLPQGFNFYSQAENVLASGAESRASASANRALSRRIKEEVFAAHTSLMRALRSHQVSLRKQEISKQNLDLVMKQYRQGGADVIRLSQAQLDYVNAQMERMRASFEASVSGAEYKRAVGETLWQ